MYNFFLIVAEQRIAAEAWRDGPLVIDHRWGKEATDKSDPPKNYAYPNVRCQAPITYEAFSQYVNFELMLTIEECGET